MLALHRDGHMHSVEVWDGDRLVGGLFGVAAGPVFTIYSMFAGVRDSSKIATAVLAAHLKTWGFELADGMLETAHLASLGFQTMPRAAFRAIVQSRATPQPASGWSLDAGLDAAAWEPASGEVPRVSPAATKAAPKSKPAKVTKPARREATQVATASVMAAA